MRHQEELLRVEERTTSATGERGRLGNAFDEPSQLHQKSLFARHGSATESCVIRHLAFSEGTPRSGQSRRGIPIGKCVQSAKGTERPGGLTPSEAVSCRMC